MRGSRTCGWGRVGQHRKSGQRGGFGHAGIHKHKWIQGTPRYEGKHGFKRSWVEPVHAVPVGNVSERIEYYVRVGAAKPLPDGGYEVHLSRVHIEKLLGSGFVDKKLIIHVERATKRAIEKVEAAGGKVILEVPHR